MVALKVGIPNVFGTSPLLGEGDGLVTIITPAPEEKILPNKNI